MTHLRRVLLSPGVLQTVLATAALALGVLVYLLDRDPQRVYFIPQWLAHRIAGGGLFGALGNHLPTFTHIYAFILLTMAVAPAPQRHRYLPLACGFWLVVESAFELAQLPSIGPVVAAHIPRWFQGVPFLENTRAYFLTSTFDAGDLVAMAIGAMAACLTARLIYRQRTAKPFKARTLSK